MLVSLVLLFSPAITSALTGLFKMLPAFSNLSDSSRTTRVRLLGAVIALVYMFAGFWVSGTLDPTALGAAVQTVLFALLAWLGSLGIFHAWFADK